MSDHQLSQEILCSHTISRLHRHYDYKSNFFQLNLKNRDKKKHQKSGTTWHYSRSRCLEDLGLDDSEKSSPFSLSRNFCQILSSPFFAVGGMSGRKSPNSLSPSCSKKVSSRSSSSEIVPAYCRTATHVSSLSSFEVSIDGNSELTGLENRYSATLRALLPKAPLFSSARMNWIICSTAGLLLVPRKSLTCVPSVWSSTSLRALLTC
mmetsp:Transcript_22672/g.55988  ORF Transcript_22672/g.55988 Transcript_22672/m.55988 type:complete len:207 (+) Transcript_22672:101-721(+)